MRRLIPFFLTFTLFLSAKAQYTECVTDNVLFHRNGASVSRLSILVPIPQSNQYQTVHNVNYDGGISCEVTDSGDKYARFQFSNLYDDSVTVGVRSEITHHVIDIDFSQINQNTSYDTTNEEYKLYTKATSGGYVDPYNPSIRSVADSIWNLSEGIVNYAFNCYNHVADNYRYLNPNTGLHPLSQILSVGGGDCGNLSSIFISLLRCKGVPSRHVVSVFSDGGCHVWAEFKIAGYGWIPVDVTYHQSDANGDYFGHYNSNAIVVGFDVGHTYSRWEENDTYEFDLLQLYHWWWWGSNGEPTTEWCISGEEAEPDAIVMTETYDMNVYQANGNIVIEMDKDANNPTVSVFDLLGRPVFMNQKMHDNRAVVPVPSSGIFIVNANGARTRKVFVAK